MPNGEAPRFVHLFSLYIALCAFRLANAWVIRTQFDPDEYWQTLEPAYCEAFAGYPCAYTWEWFRHTDGDQQHGWLTRSLHGPIRSYLSVLPTYLWYSLVNSKDWDVLLGPWVVSKGPMLVHAVLVSAPTDLCVWLSGWLVGRTGGSQKPKDVAWWALFCSLTSWFQAYAMIRTYSNSIETLLLSVGLVLTGPEFLGARGLPGFYLRSCAAFWLGGLSVAVRFTALAAWFPLGVLLAMQQSESWTARLQYVLSAAAIPGALGVVTATAVDRIFYGFWTLPFLGSLHFNVLLGQGSLYGTHPVHWYLSSGTPAIAGLLLPLILYDAWQCCTARSVQSQRNAWIVVGSYTLFHSCSAHKEFRFLLPILPLFCVRAGFVLTSLLQSGVSTKARRGRSRWNFVVSLFVLLNGLAVLYLGMWHQRAPVEIQHVIRKHVAMTKRTNYTVHYLLGCHATPLYSHLHVPSVKFQTWTLDCSPSCRQDKERPCESELFHRDPAGFVEASYLELLKDNTQELGAPCSSENECVAPNSIREVSPRPTPDLLVVMAGEAAHLEAHLAAMEMTEISRSFHGINGVRVGTVQLGEDFGSWAYRHVSPLHQAWLELSLNEMILYARALRDTSHD